MSEINVIHIKHKHTVSYLISSGNGWLMFDALWPDSFARFSETLKENRIKLRDIRYLIVSHFHMDHAGLTQILKNYGVTLLLHERQSDGISYMNEFFLRKPDNAYIPILDEGNRIVSSPESRGILAELNIMGEIISTPGHSSDSISLVIDGECVFIGDLPPFGLADSFGDTVQESWTAIQGYNVHAVYHAHGEPQRIESDR